MNVSETIEKIHKSDSFGIFVEMGCGNPVSHALCKIAGASNTIYLAENPYSKEYSTNKFLYKTRAVSVETILQIIEFWSNKINQDQPKINTIFVSSFQVGENNDISTHGYIGIKYKNILNIYHISINLSKPRSDYIELIGNIGLSLLHNMIFPNDEFIEPYFVDIVYDVEKKEIFSIEDDCNNHSILGYYNLIPNLSKSLERIHKGHESQFLYIENGEIKRIEELLRKPGDELILYKGSFNPIQCAHAELLEYCITNCKNGFGCPSISTRIVGKEDLSIKDLKWRISTLNKLGYGVVINNTPFFSDMIYYLRLKTNKKLIFPMGADTFIRISDNSNIFDNYKNIFFKIFERENIYQNDDNLFGHSNIEYIDFNKSISSTKIRNIISNFEGNKTELYEKLNDIVPAKIIEDVINRYYW